MFATSHFGEVMAKTVTILTRVGMNPVGSMPLVQSISLMKVTTLVLVSRLVLDLERARFEHCEITKNLVLAITSKNFNGTYRKQRYLVYPSN